MNLLDDTVDLPEDFVFPIADPKLFLQIIAKQEREQQMRIACMPEPEPTLDVEVVIL